MNGIKRLTAAIILAATVFLTASFGREPAQPEEPPEEPSTGTPVAYDDSAEVAEIAQRKQAHRSEVARARAEEGHKEALEAERLARIASKPEVAVSRGNNTSDGAGRAYTATFYTAYCPTGCTGVTATGYDVSNTIYTPAGLRIVAADTSVIPMYSLVQVTLADGSVFNAQVLDRGGAIKGRIIDVLVASRDEAYRLGRQSVKVHVIREGR